MLRTVTWLWPQKTEPCEMFHVLEYHALKLPLTALQFPTLTLCKFCTNVKGDILKGFMNDRVSRNCYRMFGTLLEFLSHYCSVAWYCQEMVYFKFYGYFLWNQCMFSFFLSSFFSL